MAQKGPPEVTWWRVNDQGTLGLHGKTAKGSEEVRRGRPIVWGLRWHAVTLKALPGCSWGPDLLGF